MKNKGIILINILMFVYSLTTLFKTLSGEIGDYEVWRIIFSSIGFIFFTILLIYNVKRIKSNVT